MGVSNLSQLLLRTIDAHPGRRAVWARGETLTYREFGDRALAMATMLRRLGVTYGDRVAVLSHRTVSLYASIAGVTLSGAAYVALNPRYPMMRNRIILQEAGARVLLIDARCAADVADLVSDTPEMEAIIVLDQAEGAAVEGKRCLGSDALAIDRDGMDPGLDAAGSDLAYLAFTSGSTGKPKGVMITHDNVLAYLRNIADFVGGTTPDDKVVQIVDVTFDVSVHDMFTAWDAGAALISIPENAALMANRFVQEHGITMWFSVPSTARLLEQANLLQPGSLPSIRSSIFAGEPLVSSIADAWSKATSGAPVYNIYGPTEGTISLCGKRYRPGDFSPHEVVSLGEPFAGNGMGLFEPDTDVAVTLGEVGEICFTGNQVTQGYWRRPELNETRFFTDPAGAFWYRTGDLGRYDAGRGFIFAGRVDHQVKIRGFRVELQEIEGVVRAATGASDVAVIPWPLSSDGNALGCVAFLKLGQPVDDKAIRTACLERLPDYMIPSRFHVLADMPLNANGKTDYNSLRQHPLLSG